jgi:AcrR family transcriptional regulator
VALVKGQRVKESDESVAKGQARRGAARREAILEAALEVFAERGYRAGALGEIAARVDVTAAGILYHFGSKEELLLAVIAERDRRAAEALAALPFTGGLDVLEHLGELAEAIEADRGLAMLHAVLQAESFDPEAPAHGYFLARFRLVWLWLEHMLSEAQREGLVQAEVDCSAKAREVAAFMDGAVTMWLLDEEVSLVELYRTFSETFIASLRP